jgi:hypothetical protein
MSDDKKPFTVNDRRHFTPEGEARSEDAVEGAPGVEPEGRPTPGPSPEQPPAVGEPGGPLDFIGLLVSLGAQASALLGLVGAPDAGEDQVPVDLPGARGIIGLIEILERKTEGRRTPEEDQVMAGLLYELRMAYLARAR